MDEAAAKTPWWHSRRKRQWFTSAVVLALVGFLMFTSWSPWLWLLLLPAHLLEWLWFRFLDPQYPVHDLYGKRGDRPDAPLPPPVIPREAVIAPVIAVVFVGAVFLLA